MSHYTIKVSDVLTADANYKQLTDIPQHILDRGNTTVMLYPGVYTAPVNASYKEISFIGYGNGEEIIIDGDMSIANTSTGPMFFQNMTFIGSNAAVTSESIE